MTNSTHTWGGVQLHIVAWDLYNRNPTSVTRATSNDRFTIQEPILPIASKRWVTHYPRVTKKEKETWPTASTINPKNKALLRAKGYISVVSIWGFWLKLLWVALASGWFLSLSQTLHFLKWLLPLSQSLLFLCLGSGVHVQFQEGYALNSHSSFLIYPGDLCLHIQFLKDMCTNMVVAMIFGGKLTQGAL